MQATAANTMHSALPFLHNGMHTPQVHCMYGTLKADSHVHSQYNVQTEVHSMSLIGGMSKLYDISLTCFHIFNMFVMFSRHDSLIALLPWGVYSLYCVSLIEYSMNTPC
jgi:hypothetical protein